MIGDKVYAMKQTEVCGEIQKVGGKKVMVCTVTYEFDDNGIRQIKTNEEAEKEAEAVRDSAAIIAAKVARITTLNNLLR